MSAGVLSPTFDHRACLLKIGYNKPRSQCLNIYPSTINDPLGSLIASYAILESYETNLEQSPTWLAETLNRVNNTITVSKKSIVEKATEHQLYNSEQQISDLLNLDKDIRGIIMNNENVWMDNLECGAVTFFEATILKMKAYLIAHQAFLRKAANMQMNNLKYEINLAAAMNNIEKLTECQAKCDLLQQTKLKNIITNFKLYQGLHHEKITPHFLQLSKSMDKTSKLSKLTNNGIPFSTENERNQFIKKRFQKKFWAKPTESSLANLLSFLKTVGPAPLQHNRLSESEKNKLDTPLTLDEVDRAFKKLKKVEQEELTA